MIRICGMLALVAPFLVGEAGRPAHAEAGVQAHVAADIPLLRPTDAQPNGLVSAPDGTLYFIDPFQNVVWRLANGGQPMPFVTGTSGRFLLVDDDGNVYGTHVQGRRNVLVWRADANGRMARVGRARSAAEARRLMVAAWSGDNPAPPAAWQPEGMTRLPGGELVITSGPAVRKVGLDGRVTTLADGGHLLEPRTTLLGRLLGDPPAHLTGVAAAADGDVYVANAAAGTVVRVSRGGEVENAYTSDEGWRPSGVATVAGSVFVLESGAGVRVRLLEADGASRVVASVSPTRAAAAGEPSPWLPI